MLVLVSLLQLMYQRFQLCVDGVFVYTVSNMDVVKHGLQYTSHGLPSILIVLDWNIW